MTVFHVLLAASSLSAAGSAQAESIAEGYHLWRSTSSGWTWERVDTDRPVAAVQWDGGADHWSFTVPLDAMHAVGTEHVRVGIANAALGAPVPVWVTPDEPYQRGSRAIGPLGVMLFGHAPLRNARVGFGPEGLRVDLALDAPADLRSGWDLYLLLDIDGSAETGYLGANYLVQNAGLGDGSGSRLRMPWFEARPGIVETGEEAALTLWLENATPLRLAGVDVRLALPEGLHLVGAAPPPQVDLSPSECQRFSYQVRADRPGPFLLSAMAESGGQSARSSAWLTVTDERDPEHEFQTAAGWWCHFPDRATLQAGNPAPLRPVHRRNSSDLQGNLFGVTAHIPRSGSSEDPFEVSHAADGDPSSCWASRWWRVAIPYQEEWLQVDLGAARAAAEVRLLPAWRNSGFPVAFILETSADGWLWRTVTHEHSYVLQRVPEGDPLRCGDLSWQRFTFPSRPVRYIRLRAQRLAQGNTSFFCAPFEPFQLRIAEVAVSLPDGRPVDLSHVSCTSSSTHTAWFNDPGSIERTWPLLRRSGVKLNRIGQWGDKTDWATVERERGVLSLDAELRENVSRCVESGVDVLMGLCYGSNLYQQVPDSPDFGPTWRLSHPFLQCAPTTEEAVRAFAAYCGFMAEQFRGHVRFYEVWNEENGWFSDAWANGSKISMAEAYGRALLAAARAIKAVDPEAKVVFGGTAGVSLDYPRIALDQGAGPLVDVLAFHPYGHPTPEGVPASFLARVDDHFDWRPRPDDIRSYEDEIAALQRLGRQYNPNMEVWADEMNWFAPGEPAMASQGDMGELTQAKYLARFFTLNAWLGCRAVWWSLYNANGVQEWAIVRSADETPRPAYYSAGYLATALDGATGVRDVSVSVGDGAPDDLYVKPFAAPDGRLLVALWRATPARDDCEPVPVTLRLPGGAQGAVELIDTLYGSRQPANVVRQNAHTEIRGLLVGDWVLIAAIAAH